MNNLAFKTTNDDQVLFSPKGVTHTCEQLLGKKEHCVLGISPFNSYFSEKTIYQLCKWAQSNFKSFSIFMPDQSSEHTLRAMGYSDSKAKQKAKNQGNYLFNKCTRALSRSSSFGDPKDVIWNCERLFNNPEYQAFLSMLLELYGKDVDFRERCVQTSKWVLSNKSNIYDENLSIAVRYFLEELPLFLHSDKIMKKESSLFCYHSCPDLVSELFSNTFSKLKIENNGFILIDQLKKES